MMLQSGGETGFVLEPEKKIPVWAKCDVLVGGGGTAGCVAALAAARGGADTVLLEQHGTLGGMLINGATALHSFFNTFGAFPGVPEKKVVEGIAQEIVDRCQAAGGSPGHVRVDPKVGAFHDSYCTVIDHEVYKGVMAQMLREAGVRVLLHSCICDAIMEGNRIRGVVIENKSGRQAVLGGVTVDCTGDGDIAYLAGVPFTSGHEKYGVSLTFGISGVDVNRAAEYMDARGMLHQVARGSKSSRAEETYVRCAFDLSKDPALREKLQDMHIRAAFVTSAQENCLTYVNALSVGGIDPTSAEDLTRAEMELRVRVLDAMNDLREAVPGFERAYISWTANQASVRMSRNFRCQYDLTNEECCAAKKFTDEVGYAAFHDLAPFGYNIKDAGWVGLPYRMMLPVDVEGLLLAGRMLCSEYEAQMIVRNTVACMVLGQGAGTAAALCAKSNVLPGQLNTDRLRACLKADGVYLE